LQKAGMESAYGTSKFGYRMELDFAAILFSLPGYSDNNQQDIGPSSSGGRLAVLCPNAAFVRLQ